jgi:SAM-dependent methyltransferase
MFEKLDRIFTRPGPFEFYTTDALWTDEHTSEQMLKFHLDGEINASSRKSEFISRSADWMASYFNIGEGTRIADFGCGPGLYARELAPKKADVTGIDFSKRSISHARLQAAREGLQIRYINENYLDFEPDGRFHLVLMIMCDFCALSPAQRKTMLDRFHRILEPGGSVVLDVYSLKAYDRRREESACEAGLLNGFWSPERYYGFLNIFRYDEEKVVLDKYTIIEASRTRTIYNWLQYFSPESLEPEFAGSGFKVDRLFSDVAGTPFDPESDEFAVVATKQ